MAGNTVTVSVLADTAKFKKDMQGLDGFGKSFGKGFAGGLGLVSSALAAVGFTQIAGDAVEASDATDKFKKTLDFGGIKTDRIDALTKSTQAYADKTVYSLKDVQGITATLATNGVKGYDVLAEALGNLNAVAGGNSETFKRVGSVMTQTAGAGKLTTENWNQLADAIPGASGILQESLKKSGAYTGNFRDAMSKGQITAEEFFAAVKENGLTDAAKDAASSTSTFEGSWGNLQATLTGGVADILTAIKPFATKFLESTAKVVGPALTTVKDVIVKDVIPAIQGFSDWFTKTALPAMEGFFKFIADNKDTLGVLVAAIAGGAAAFGLWTGAIKAWNIVTEIAIGIQKVFNAVTKLNPIMIIVIAVAALVAGLIYFFTQTETGKKIWADFTKALADGWKGFTEFLQKAWETITQAFDGGVKAVSKFMSDAQNAIVNAWNAVMKFFNELPGKIMGVFNAAGTWLVNAGRGIMDGLRNGITGAWNAVSSWVGGTADRIRGALGNAGDMLAGAGRAIMDGFLTGLRNSWKAVTDFVGGIATWIRNNKGPLSYDYKLLQPAGKAIMGGFGDSLSTGFNKVQDMVSGFAPELAGAMAGTFSGDLQMAAARNGGTFYSFDGLTFNTANAEEASMMEEFLTFLRRKSRAA